MKMGISIVLILVLVSFIYNIAKKNNIKLNLLFCIIPIVLTGASIYFTNDTTSLNEAKFIDCIHLASCIIALIFALIAILLVIKDRKTIRTAKSFLLIGMVIIYMCIMVLTLPKYKVFFTGDYFRVTYMTTISISLLLILQINLFVNLISNNKKEIIDNDDTQKGGKNGK